MTKRHFPLPILVNITAQFYQQLSNTSTAFPYLTGSQRPFQILHIQESSLKYAHLLYNTFEGNVRPIKLCQTSQGSTIKKST